MEQIHYTLRNVNILNTVELKTHFNKKLLNMSFFEFFDIVNKLKSAEPITFEYSAVSIALKQILEEDSECITAHIEYVDNNNIKQSNSFAKDANKWLETLTDVQKEYVKYFQSQMICGG